MVFTAAFVTILILIVLVVPFMPLLQQLREQKAAHAAPAGDAAADQQASEAMVFTAAFVTILIFVVLVVPLGAAALGLAIYLLAAIDAAQSSAPATRPRGWALGRAWPPPPGRPSGASSAGTLTTAGAAGRSPPGRAAWSNWPRNCWRWSAPGRFCPNCWRVALSR